MTRFNPDADLRPIEEWEELAQRAAVETGASWRILSGIVAGGVGFALSFELLGIVAGGYLCYSAYERLRRSGQDLKAIRDFGCVAHLLHEQEFRSFVKQFGDKEVLQQVDFAIKRNWNVSSFARNWLKTYHHQPIQDKQPVREFNQNHQTPFPNNTTTQTQLYDPTQNNQIDIISELSDRVSNIFIVGIGGSGKGMLLANALREVKRKHPDKKIFLINGKVDDKEFGYFDGVVDVEKKLHCESAKPQTVAAWFDAAISEFDDFAVQHNGALLVIDEGTIIGARLKTAKCTALTDKLIGITSCGGSSGKNVWFVAQTPFVGANGSDVSSISQLTPVVLVNSTNLSVVDNWKRASLFKKFDTEEIAELVEQSECNRAVYFGKTAQWYSMPKLINYSSFNRDSGEIVGDKKTPQKTIIQQLEDSFNSDTNAQKIEEIPLPVKAQIALTIIQNCQNPPVKFDAIRKSREWSRNQLDNPSSSQVKKILSFLIVQELIDGSESEGYVFGTLEQ